MSIRRHIKQNHVIGILKNNLVKIKKNMYSTRISKIFVPNAGQ